MNARDILLDGIKAIERYAAEKAEITAIIRTRMDNLKAAGFDPAVVKAILKRRQMSPEQRESFDALLQTYEAALGGLGTTPLGEAARKRLDGGRAQPDGAEAGRFIDDAPAPEDITPEKVAEAREAGRTAQADGKRVIDNPYVFGDPRRAAWDEGWCIAAGSDGMDIPEAWRATKPEKAKKTVAAAAPGDEDAPPDPEAPGDSPDEEAKP